MIAALAAGCRLAGALASRPSAVPMTLFYRNVGGAVYQVRRDSASASTRPPRGERKASEKPLSPRLFGHLNSLMAIQDCLPQESQVEGGMIGRTPEMEGIVTPHTARCRRAAQKSAYLDIRHGSATLRESQL